MTTLIPEGFTHHHVWLNRAFARQAKDIGGASLQLWEHLAQELIGIIGEVGFDSLYSRCIYLLQSKNPEFSCLQLERNAASISARFTQLKLQLNQQEPVLAELASRTLFDTFLQLLSNLIGVGLTLNILQVAWNGAFPEQQDAVQKQLTP
jgi:hypothetical protein